VQADKSWSGERGKKARRVGQFLAKYLPWRRFRQGRRGKKAAGAEIRRIQFVDFNPFLALNAASGVSLVVVVAVVVVVEKVLRENSGFGAAEGEHVSRNFFSCRVKIRVDLSSKWTPFFGLLRAGEKSRRGQGRQAGQESLGGSLRRFHLPYKLSLASGSSGEINTSSAVKGEKETLADKRKHEAEAEDEADGEGEGEVKRAAEVEVEVRSERFIQSFHSPRSFFARSLGEPS